MTLFRSVVATVSVAALPLAAQTAATPVGPMVGATAPWMAGDSARFGIRLHALDSWGYRSPATTAGLDVPLGPFTLGISGGFEPSRSAKYVTQSYTSGVVMAGVSLGRPISVAQLGKRTIASLGIVTSTGFRHMGDSYFQYSSSSGPRREVWSESEASGALTLPMALSFRGAGIIITPHFAPGIEFARKVRDVRYSTEGFRGQYPTTDTRLLFGTGLSLDFARIGMGLDLFTRASSGRYGSTTLGVGIRWNR